MSKILQVNDCVIYASKNGASDLTLLIKTPNPNGYDEFNTMILSLDVINALQKAYKTCEKPGSGISRLKFPDNVRAEMCKV